MKTVLVTGGAGFIGSALIRELINNTNNIVVNVDALTYAGNLQSLSSVDQDERYFFEHVNICDQQKLEDVFKRHQPDIVMHLAAESHVDRSIDSPHAFIQTNIVGTYILLEVCRSYWNTQDTEKRAQFRFHHVSTDEVFGDLDDSEKLFVEETPYQPSSPYSASKASADHLVRAWHRTYDMPVVLTNCSNNYGPCHFPEKMIPLMILNALEGKAMPIYGDGSQIRDWLYVEDHARALIKVATQGKLGETYNIGGHNEKRNIEVVNAICQLLNELRPMLTGRYEDLISFVKDRPGHDKRYAIDAEKIKNELGWIPLETFESGLRKTVLWYLENQLWCEDVLSGTYRRERLGLTENS